MALPALRPISIYRTEIEKETVVVIRDQNMIIDTPIALSPAAFFVAAMLDGENDVSDIKRLYLEDTGIEINEDDIRHVVDFLDEAGLLMTEQFQKKYREAIESFNTSPVRKAYFAGRSYPEAPEQLDQFLNESFSQTSGMEWPGTDENLEEDYRIRGLIVPHIDFSRGAKVYARGYKQLLNGPPPDLVFIFGVTHDMSSVPFVLTRKDFETPYGVMKTDVEVVDTLASECSVDMSQYEFIHRGEHSIEFQAVLLQKLFGDRMKIIPILCGTFLNDGLFQNGMIDTVHPFLEACQEVIKTHDQNVLVMAAADFAHVGRLFGDAFTIEQSHMYRVEERDQADLAHVYAPDADAWLRSVYKDENERRVCGVNAIYALLKSLEGIVQEGRLIEYAQSINEDEGLVSYAAVSLS